MKTLGVILVSATMLLASCANNCHENVGENGFRVEDGNGVVGTPDGNNADGYTNNNGTSNGTNRGNTSTTDGDNASANSTKTQNNDPRTYGTSSGGVGYRTDTLNEYDGIDGSARDKGDLDEVPNPK